MSHTEGEDQGLDEGEVREYVRLHNEFIQRMMKQFPPPRSISGMLTDRIGKSPLGMPVVSRSFPSFEIANVQLALAQIEKDHSEMDKLGVAGLGKQYRNFSELVADLSYEIGPVDYQSVPISPTDTLTCISCGFLFLEYGDPAEQLVIWLRSDDPDDRDGMTYIDVISENTERAGQFLAELEENMTRLSVYRSRVISIDPHSFERGVGPIRFHRPSEVTREDVVLPDGVLDLIERQVAGIAENREWLIEHGQHLKRGILLFGPPGSGKTHIINYLLNQLPDFTVVLVTGTAVERIGSVFSIARKLHPALVVLEDVDLIAEERSVSHTQPVLVQLLNEIDGVGADVDLAFILTTNRVEILERALAARPGRVDLAVEIPAPDKEGLRRLFRIYAAGLGLSDDQLDRLADRCTGVTASFVKEASRRAVLIAADEQAESVTLDHFDTALDEMLSQKDDLTRRLLGSRIAGERASDDPGPGGYA